MLDPTRIASLRRPTTKRYPYEPPAVDTRFRRALTRDVPRPVPGTTARPAELRSTTREWPRSSPRRRARSPRVGVRERLAAFDADEPLDPPDPRYLRVQLRLRGQRAIRGGRRMRFRGPIHPPAHACARVGHDVRLHRAALSSRRGRLWAMQHRRVQTGERRDRCARRASSVWYRCGPTARRRGRLRSGISTGVVTIPPLRGVRVRGRRATSGRRSRQVPGGRSVVRLR